jgi:hypothetical protein
MWTDLQVQGTLSLAKGVGSYVLASRQAKSDRAWQAYNNSLTRLQNAQNQNAISMNEGLAIERNTREKFNIDVSEYRTKASATVAAGAMGSEGNSVDAVLTDISRNATNARAAQEQDFQAQLLGFRQQSEASNLQTEMQQYYTHIPKPSIAGSLLGVTADVSNKWIERKLGLNRGA